MFFTTTKAPASRSFFIAVMMNPDIIELKEGTKNSFKKKKRKKKEEEEAQQSDSLNVVMDTISVIE